MIDNLIQYFGQLFYQLGEGQQIGQWIRYIIHECFTWFHNLSSNQRLFIAVSIVCFVIVLRQTFRLLMILRRWLRRKRIPKNVELHLDRDSGQRD